MRCSFGSRTYAFVALLVSIAILSAGSGTVAAPATAPADPPASRPAPPTDSQIRQMIHQLSHPVPTRRRAAIRQLAEWGPATFPELRRTAQSGDMEAALSARSLLEELQSAVLLGAQVRLEVSRARLAWNEPFTLTVHAFNPTGEPIEVPWPAGADRPSTQPASTTAPATQPSDAEVRQVAAMMDAGDFLVVTGPDGHEIEARVEPIERDRRVYDAVNLRARGKPPSHPLAAGASDNLVIPAFNRGWARYPMLKAGRYTIAFSYQPQWNDATWTKEGFGRVRSQPVTVEITEPAPMPIGTSDQAVRMNLTREGDSLVAELESMWDHDLWINLNIGGNLHMHAQIEWHLDAKQSDSDQPIRWLPESTGEGFSLQRVHLLKPGQRLVIGRAPIAALRETLSKMPHPPARVEVSVHYVSLGTPPQIREETAEKRPPVDVPTHLFSGTVTSEPVALEAR